MIKICVATYKQFHSLQVLLHSLMGQTDDDFDVIVISDGKDDDFYAVRDRIESLEPQNINFTHTQQRYNDYGHSLRDLYLRELTCDNDDFILLTNGDNYYTPNFIEEINNVIKSQDVDVVYFDMIHSHNRIDSSSKSTYGFFQTEFSPCKCDIGAFVVRASIAKQIMFPYRNHDGDADYIRDIKQLTNKIVKINKVLFVHN